MKLKPKNLNLRSSRMIKRNANLSNNQPVQRNKLKATLPKLFYISPIPDGQVDSRNEKIVFGDKSRLMDVTVTSYNSNDVTNVTKLSLLKLLGITQTDNPNLYEFTINYKDISYSYDGQTTYRFTFPDDEKNRCMKLFDDDGWATIFEDKEGRPPIQTRIGNSEYLSMYNVTYNDPIYPPSKKYAIKVKDVEIIEK